MLRHDSTMTQIPDNRTLSSGLCLYREFPSDNDVYRRRTTAPLRVIKPYKRH
jgi:hypothetical protein